VAQLCWHYRIPLLYQSDSNFLAERRSPAWRRWLKRQILRLFFRRVSVFLACGDHNRDYLEYYGVPSKQIHFSAIPVDTARFHMTASGMGPFERAALRKEYDLAPEDFVAGFCGKLVDHKRPLDLLKAVGLVNRNGLKALFIGTGPLESEMKKRGGAASYTGFVNQSMIPRILSLCDVVVVASEKDAHPLTVTEAACLGIPVVLSDQCGCYGPHDVFRDGETGVLYPCGDINRMAEGLAWLMDHSEQRTRLGRRAAELAEVQSVQATARHFLMAVDLAREQSYRTRT
jgi:glycosyltransferase involved in cell wall biosynthesis